MSRFTRRHAVGLLAAGLFAPFAGATLGHAAEKLPVVASFSILADFVARVGGDRVAITTLVGPNGDAHVYSPKPADARAVKAAKLVVVNGLGFEGWMERLVGASGTKAILVTASKGISARELVDDDEDEAPAKGGKAGHDHAKEAHGHGHDHGGLDPHAWQSVANARVYVGNIRDALIAADPDGRAVYEANAGAYVAELDALEAEVKAAVAAVPAERRRMITTHDAFGYFAAAYGITFLSAQGVSTETEATPKQVARLIGQIRKEKVGAVFIENMTDGRLVDRIAKETGVRPGGELFSDALSPKGGPAPTYVDMVRYNVRLMTRAMIGA
jgi:zinc/manganese transport system substrate-binding protein